MSGHGPGGGRVQEWRWGMLDRKGALDKVGGAHLPPAWGDRKELSGGGRAPALQRCPRSPSRISVGGAHGWVTWAMGEIGPRAVGSGRGRREGRVRQDVTPSREERKGEHGRGGGRTHPQACRGCTAPSTDRRGHGESQAGGGTLRGGGKPLPLGPQGGTREGESGLGMQGPSGQAQGPEPDTCINVVARTTARLTWSTVG